MSLTNYIKEKLIINKDYEEYSDKDIIEELYNAIETAKSRGFCEIIKNIDCCLKYEIDKTIERMWSDPSSIHYREKIKKIIFDFYEDNIYINNTYKKGRYKQCIVMNGLWKIEKNTSQMEFSRIYWGITKNNNYDIEEVKANTYNFVYCKVGKYVLFNIVNSQNTLSELIILEL